MRHVQAIHRLDMVRAVALGVGLALNGKDEKLQHLLEQNYREAYPDS